MPTKGYIHSLETFGLVDGPGVRCVAFMKGCAMRCKFCHNPETWKGSGEEWDAQSLWKKMYRYKSYWGKDGGITVSGGEPLLQIDFVTELFTIAKENGVSTVLDTSGQPFCDDEDWMKRFENLMAVTDLVMLDLKQMNKSVHRELTGYENANILRMAQWLSDNSKAMWIRHVLIPGVTDDEADLLEMKNFISELKTVEKIEILPYHTLGILKWKELGMAYPLEGVPTPTDEQVIRAEKLLGLRE